MIRIILVEDHMLFREGLKSLFSSQNNQMQIVAEAASAGEAIRAIRSTPSDIVVADFSLRDSNVFGVLEHLSPIGDAPPVLVLSMHDEKKYALRLFRNGASGYLLKNADPKELLEAIRRVAQGKKYISPRVADLMADTLNGEAEDPIASLTNREFQILSLIVDGLSTGEMAKQLNLQPSTISTYKDHLRKKLGKHSDGTLVRFALQNGFGDAPGP